MAKKKDKNIEIYVPSCATSVPRNKEAKGFEEGGTLMDLLKEIKWRRRKSN